MDPHSEPLSNWGPLGYLGLFGVPFGVPDWVGFLIVVRELGPLLGVPYCDLLLGPLLWSLIGIPLGGLSWGLQLWSLIGVPFGDNLGVPDWGLDWSP